MADKPTVAEGDWIEFGIRDAVVCAVNTDPGLSYDIEAVYLDNVGDPFCVCLKWDGDKWDAVYSDATYADKPGRFVDFVRILREGRH